MHCMHLIFEFLSWRFVRAYATSVPRTFSSHRARILALSVQRGQRSAHSKSFCETIEAESWVSHQT